jgi:hypothetical protein
MAGSDGRQAFAALAAAVAQRGAAGLGGFAGEKPVLPLAAHFLWLILAFHKLTSFRDKTGAREDNHESGRVKARFDNSTINQH